MQQVTKKSQNHGCNELDVQQTVTKSLSPQRHMVYFGEIKQHSIRRWINVKSSIFLAKRKTIFPTMNHSGGLLRLATAPQFHVWTRPFIIEELALSNFRSFCKHFWKCTHQKHYCNLFLGVTCAQESVKNFSDEWLIYLCPLKVIFT